MCETQTLCASRCGLFCYGCKSYIEGICKGCKAEEESETCIIHKCVKDKALDSCLQCAKLTEDCPTWKKALSARILHNKRKALMHPMEPLVPYIASYVE